MIPFLQGRIKYVGLVIAIINAKSLVRAIVCDSWMFIEIENIRLRVIWRVIGRHRDNIDPHG
jgi:hypothetical protein